MGQGKVVAKALFVAFLQSILMDFVAVCCLQCYHRLQQLRYYAHSRFV
jgi:hypothetical protein